LVRNSQRHQADQRRRTYEVTFPRDLDHSAVLNFVRSLSGPLRPLLIPPAATVVVEVYADIRGFKFFLSLPEHVTAGIESLLTTHLAGSAISTVDQADDVMVSTAWSRVIEVGTSSAHVPLRIGAPAAVVAGLLSSFTNLKDGDALAQQWVITGARPQGKPREDRVAPWPRRTIDAEAHGKKNNDVTFLAVGRLAAKGGNAAELLHRLHGHFASLRAPGVSIKRRPVGHRVALERLHERASVLVFPAHFNALELTVILGIPFGQPSVPGLSSARARRLAADHTIPSEGLVIGRSNFPGAERPVALRPEDLLKHTHIHGKTGVGKSVLLTNLAVAQMVQGYGVGLIDPTGDTAADVLERIPPHRWDDVVVFDPTDTDYPVGFNVFSGTGNPEVLADQMMAIFHGIYKDNGIWANNYLRAAIQTLATVPGMTLVEVPMFLTDQGFRSRVVRQVADPMLQHLWQRFDQMKRSEQLQVVMPAIHRVQPLLLRRSVRLTLGQAENQLDMSALMAQRKILIVSLPKGLLGEETAALFGSLIFARMWQAAMGRPRDDRHPFFLHIDEAQNFLHMPIALSDVLAESRKYGLGLTLAHQHESQLPLPLRAAIHANTRTKIAFAVSAEDAHFVAREVGPPVTPADLIALGQYEVVIQATTDNQTSAPATARTLPPLEPISSPAIIRAASRRRWARPAADVEAELMNRHQAGPLDEPASRGWEEV
jgi:hypothetical protein